MRDPVLTRKRLAEERVLVRSGVGVWVQRGCGGGGMQTTWYSVGCEGGGMQAKCGQLDSVAQALSR